MISMKVSFNMSALPPRLAWYAKQLSAMKPAGVMHRMRDALVVQSPHMRHRLSGTAAAARYGYADIPSHRFCASTDSVLPDFPWDFRLTDMSQSELLSGHMPVFSHEWTWRPDGSVWHEAPDTKQQWPRVFFHRIHHGADNPHGDIHIAWEPSRLQHLITLALYARQAPPDMRQRAVEMIEAQLLSWIAANPPLMGIHYVSVMECALRLLAVCHALDLIRGWLTDPQRVWVATLNLVSHHAEFIRKRSSGYGATGHHTIAEAAGLIYAGLLFPEMELAERWLAFGLYVLESEAARQIRQDGGGREESFASLQLVSDLYGLVVHLLRHCDRPVHPKLDQAFARSASFLQAMMRPEDGQLPRIGEDDGGYELSPFLRFVPPPSVNSPGLTSFHLSGYSIIRGPNRQRLLFDHGELGMAPGFSRGHADALAVALEIGGQELLIDPGTYSVTQDTAWRQYFRSTRAHNTVTVNGQDQAMQETGFQWAQPYATHLIYREEAPNGTIGQEQIQLSIERVQVSLPFGEENPIRGWRSASYGSKTAAMTLRAEYRGALLHEFMTRIWLGEGEPPQSLQAFSLSGWSQGTSRR